MIGFKILITTSSKLIVMLLAVAEMSLHEEKDDETANADQKGQDGEQKGEEQLLDPERSLWLIGEQVVGEEIIDSGGIAMGDKMLDGDTVR